MTHPASPLSDGLSPDPLLAATASRHGLSWGAIVAGALAAAALSLILLILGAGLGLSSVSPWSGRGAGAATFGVASILWLTFMQLAASGIGGYMAGRLRQRWPGVHRDEVYFRDTAHGFLAWALASLLTAALLTSAITGIVGGAAQAGAGVATAGGAAAVAASKGGGAHDATGEGADPTGYVVDLLFRPAGPIAAASPTAAVPPAAGATPAAPLTAMPSAASGGSPVPVPTAEVVRILVNAQRVGGTLPPEDTAYLGQLVSQRTGMPQADAEKRVSDAYNKLQTQMESAKTTARDAADKARKASAYAALWLFIALLAGAFLASLMATFGGRLRDA